MSSYPPKCNVRYDKRKPEGTTGPNKAQLVTMAKGLDLLTSGTKAQICQRIAKSTGQPIKEIRRLARVISTQETNKTSYQCFVKKHFWNKELQYPRTLKGMKLWWDAVGSDMYYGKKFSKKAGSVSFEDVPALEKPPVEQGAPNLVRLNFPKNENPGYINFDALGITPKNNFKIDFKQIFEDIVCDKISVENYNSIVNTCSAVPASNQASCIIGELLPKVGALKTKKERTEYVSEFIQYLGQMKCTEGEKNRILANIIRILTNDEKAYVEAGED